MAPPEEAVSASPLLEEAVSASPLLEETVSARPRPEEAVSTSPRPRIDDVARPFSGLPGPGGLPVPVRTATCGAV